MRDHPTRQPNHQLTALITQSGASRKALAHRINELSRLWGAPSAYTHTSLANWEIRGMTPRWPTPKLLAQALAERLGRPVALAQIGMAGTETTGGEIGLDYPRDLPAAIRVATTFWSTVNRRDFLAGPAFAAAAYTTPVRRWLITSADATTSHRGTRHVGGADITELADAAEDARRWDSKYGGGNWRTASLTTVLADRATPLLHGSYTDRVGRDLFTATAQLARLAGWTAFDTGDHHTAQRHYIQALRLARAAGDLPLGGYVLTCMALQASLRDFHDDALDMIHGALARTHTTATPRVRAFFHLIEARIHARTGHRRNAGHALATADTLLDRAAPSDPDPQWIDFFDHARLAADTTEIHRDLHMLPQVQRWNTDATMQTALFPRSYGMRLAIVGSAHAHAGDLHTALHLGHQSVTILTNIASARARDYLRELLTALQPWQREKAFTDFTRRTNQTLGIRV